MKKALVLLMLAIPAYAITGLGKSTLTCLDKDGDGYGVGPGCLGPDADDNDPTVQNATQAIAKYGTLRSFLAHLGYNPGHIFYLSTSGNDSTGAVDDPTRPYQTWSKMNLFMANGTFSPGDMVMFRGGTWTGMTPAPISGTSGKPVMLMAYPGETVWIDNHVTGATVIQVTDKSFITVDGLKVSGGLGTAGCITGGTPDAKTSSTSHDIVFRNIEATNCFQGLIFMNGLINLTMEDNLIHGSSAGGQHCIYIGSRGLPSSNVTLQRNICYNAAWNGFHINGRFTNLHVDQNIIYSAGIAGISLQEGISNSFFRNNLVFNTSSQGIEISNYPGDCAQFGQGGNGSICPYDQTGNLFENNTVYQTGYDGAGVVVQQPAVKVKNNAIGRVGDLGHQTWRNNIFVGYGGAGHYPSVVYVDGDKDYLATSVFGNNIFWSLDGASTTAVIGFGYNSNYGYQGYTCSQAAAITTISGCMNVGPNFANASPAYHSSPTQFNFALLAGSPAIGSGTTVNAPVVDILGATRASPPGIGAFEANSALSGSPVALSSVTCTPASLSSGAISTCTVVLSRPAGSGNAAVTLSSNTSALTVPATITVAAGSMSATFTATAGTISAAQSALLTATLSGASQTASVALLSSQSTGGSSGPGGWQELANTHLQDVCPPKNFQPLVGLMPAYDFFGNCYNVIAADSGGVADTKRNRLIIWGGGHSGYQGNELYALNLNASPPTLLRLNNPSIFDPVNSNLEVNISDGTPPSRHSFGGLVYLPIQDKMFAWEGVSFGGRSLRHTWLLDMNTLVWSDMHPELTPGSFDVTAGTGSVSGAECAYDPNTQKVFCAWGSHLQLLQYDPVANKWTRLISFNICTGFSVCNSAAAASAVIDPVHKNMILIGNSNAGSPAAGQLVVWAIDISAGGGYVVSNWSSQVTACSALNVDFPGLVYDPTINRIVAYPNDGNTVYLFDPVAKTCTPQTYPKGPPPSGLVPPNGTFGRFAYFPVLGKYALVNKATNNAYTLTLGAPGSGGATCDLNGDGLVTIVDVQLGINQALGSAPCTNADLQQDGQCNVVDVQRLINATLTGVCTIGM